MPETFCLELSKFTGEKDIPLIIVRSYGLIGYLRNYAKELKVVESKPDKDQTDLRLNDPFSELREFVNSYKLEDLPDHLHSHVPYVVLLVKFMD